MRHLLVTWLFITACGGDEGGSAPPPAAAPKAAAKKTGKVAAPKGGVVRYPQIEDEVSEAEKPKIRRAFRDSDFTPDVTGTDNRDPFRSYLILPAGTRDQRVVATPQCSRAQQVASNYSVRDLRLVGIIGLTSTMRFAQFQDGGNLGHKVKRNDCLGREKARVKEIGRGFVTVEIAVESTPGMAPAAPEERTIPLYPSELRVQDEIVDDAAMEPVPVTPTTVELPAPTTTTAPPAPVPVTLPAQGATP